MIKCDPVALSILLLKPRGSSSQNLFCLTNVNLFAVLLLTTYSIDIICRYMLGNLQTSAMEIQKSSHSQVLYFRHVTILLWSHTVNILPSCFLSTPLFSSCQRVSHYWWYVEYLGSKNSHSHSLTLVLHSQQLLRGCQ